MDITRDPATANCRVYCGNLPENCRTEFEERFHKYGNVVGIAHNRGFAFVQYDSEESANEAIKLEDQSQLMGRKIVVRHAINDKSGGSSDNNGGRGSRGRGGNRGNRGGGGGNKQIWNDRERDRSPLDDRDRGNNNQGAGREDWQTPQQQNIRDRSDNFGNYGMNHQYNRSGSSVVSVGGGGNSGYTQTSKPSDYNDCEIIVVSRTLTEYAEMIESQLKRRGLSVDLLFPNDDVPIGKVLANISSRGTLYAILVTPQNEEHRSITVNILYGTPAEHRNMPIDDAMAFIYTNFQQKMAADKAGVAAPTAVPINSAIQSVPPLSERHPDPIQVLFNLLANNRPLTMLQYDRIVQYLQERRDLQRKVEYGDDTIDMKAKQAEAAAVAAAAVAAAARQEEELQKKILSILNKPSIMSNNEPVSAPKPAYIHQQQAQPANSSRATLLHDPKVQKALDSLLHGSSLSNLF